jgi:hypothetical protein
MLKLILKSLAANTVDLVLMVLGLFVVPVLLPFGSYQTNFNNELIYRLPKIGIIWDNAHDGADGDSRGWWAANCGKEAYYGLFPKIKFDSFLARYWWLVFRNPINYYKRLIMGVDASKFKQVKCFGNPDITDKPGNNGFYLAYWSDGNKIIMSCEICLDWEDGTAFYCQFGYKLKASKDYTKVTDITRFKSQTFEINFSKNIS